MATEEKTSGMDVFRAFLWLVKLIFAIIMIVVGLGLFFGA